MFRFSPCWSFFSTSLLVVLLGVYLWVPMLMLSWDFGLKTFSEHGQAIFILALTCSPNVHTPDILRISLLAFISQWTFGISTSICAGKRLAWIRHPIRQWLVLNYCQDYPDRQPYTTLNLTQCHLFRVLNTSVRSKHDRENRSLPLNTSLNWNRSKVISLRCNGFSHPSL